MNFNKKIVEKTESKRLDKLLFRLVGYFNGEMNMFSRQNGILAIRPAHKGFSPKIIIVAHNYYSEKVETYPLENKKELTKLLKLQASKGKYSLIQNTSNNNTQVNIWKFKDIVQMGTINIPETYILGEQLAKNEVLTINEGNNKQLFITNFENAIYSASSNQLINSVDRFITTTGICATNKYSLLPEQKVTAIYNSFKAIELKRLITFVSLFDVFDLKKALMNFSIPLGIISFLYFGATSLYLLGKQNSISAEIASQNEAIVELLNIQQENNKLSNLIGKIDDFQKNRSFNVGLWVVLAPIFEIAKVNNISVLGNTIKVRGETDQASSLLDLIAKNPNVFDAKFDSPVRKSRDNERFNISFELTHELLMSSEARGQ